MPIKPTHFKKGLPLAAITQSENSDFLKPFPWSWPLLTVIIFFWSLDHRNPLCSSKCVSPLMAENGESTTGSTSRFIRQNLRGLLGCFGLIGILQFKIGWCFKGLEDPLCYLQWCLPLRAKNLDYLYCHIRGSVKRPLWPWDPINAPHNLPANPPGPLEITKHHWSSGTPSVLFCPRQQYMFCHKIM